MTELITIDAFRGREGETFVLHATPDLRFDLTLDHVRALNQGAGNREPFSLEFRGPTDPVLAQRIFRFTNEGLGELEIFIVPIGVDADGARYEAVFT